MLYTPRMRVFAALFAVTFAGASLCSAQSPVAGQGSPMMLKTASQSDSQVELIFFDGVIYTGEGLADGKPRTVVAMAVGGGKVLAVGSNEEIKRLEGPKTLMRDLKGAGKTVFVFPGFNDAHTHLGMAARTKMNLDLRGVESLTAMLAKIAEFARSEERRVGKECRSPG